MARLNAMFGLYSVGYLGGSHEDGLLADFRTVQSFARVDVEQEQVAHLGDHEDDIMLGSHLAGQTERSNNQ